MSATYTKLRSGEWGIRVQGAAKEGQTYSVTKKSGETKQERVSKVVFTGSGVSLCAIAESAPSRSVSYARHPATSPRGRWSGCSCGSREDNPRDSDCAQCRFDNE